MDNFNVVGCKNGRNGFRKEIKNMIMMLINTFSKKKEKRRR